MKTFGRRASCVLGCIFLSTIFSIAARAADTNPLPRLTVELRDGSRVVGDSVAKNIEFQSALLGKVKLAVKDIHSVECVSSNSAKLSTVNGDSLTVAFVDSSFAVKTSFGKVDLQVSSVRKFSVSASGTSAHPAGLVALWSGEGDGLDSIGGNTAMLTDITFAEGKVGQAFSLNGLSSWMKIPARPSLDVGKGDGLTITAWIKPSDVTSFRPIVEWSAVTQVGVHLWLGHLPQQHGELFANVIDDAGHSHPMNSAQGVIVPGQFQHIALTYDKAGGVAVLYVNGCVVMQQNLGSFTPQTSYDLLISRRPGDHPGDWTYNAFYVGLLDEIAIYNRALSAEEIKSVGITENNGEPLPPPASSPMPFNRIYYRNGSANGFGE